MIKIFEQTIKEHLPEYLNENVFSLSYLKFSTVASGSGLHDKVIFLVFKNHASLPFLCLKTIRNYGAKEAISRNFYNLKTLNTITVGSSYDRLFARALYLYDDGENIFSIETACPGKKINLDTEKLRAVVTDYIGFQEYLAKQSGHSVRDMKELTKETIIKSGLKEAGQHKLLTYITQLPPSTMKLPRLIQHGDLTMDNLLFSKSGLCIIDYDYVGSTDIPGFDLFGLFHRFNQIDSLKLCKEYFPAYFEKIGGKFLDGNYRGLVFLYHLIEHTQGRTHHSRDMSPEQIILDFERLYL